MKIYLLVEGEVGEKKVYASWIRYYQPKLSIVNYISDLKANSVYIISGMGYPNYFDFIDRAILDVYENDIDLLIVAIDAEDMTYEEKEDEVRNFIERLPIKINYRIIIQNFCLETWALGNRVIVGRSIQSSQLRNYLSFYNVLINDPELLPSNQTEGLNRAQFAALYLKKLLNEKYRNLTYSKRNPQALLHKKYYERVVERFKTTGHISSFRSFLDAFK